MQSINHVMIMGNLGADPELFHGKTGTPYCRFSVATNYVRKDEKGESQRTTNWHRVKVFGKTAEHCSTYLRKGSIAVVDGYIQNQSYKKADGTDGHSSEIIGQHVSFVNTPRDLSKAGTESNFETRMADAIDLATSLKTSAVDAGRVTAGLPNAAPRARNRRSSESAVNEVPF